MINVLRRYFFVAALVISCTTNAKAAEPEIVRRLLEASGFTWHMSRNMLAIETIPARLLNSPSPAFKAAWGVAVQETFNPKEQMQELEAGIAAQMSDEDVRFLLTYLETPLAARIKQIEQSGSNPNATIELRNAAEDELARLVQQDPARLTAYRGLAKDTRYVDRTEVMAISSLQLHLEAIACSGQTQITETQVRDKLEEARSRNRPFLENLVMLNIVNSYEPLTASEIESYAGFLSSEPAKRFYRSILDVTSSVLPRRAENFRSNLAKALGTTDC